MPRIERRTLRAHRQLSATQVFTLASGCDWFNEWKTPAGAVDRAAIQLVWHDLAPELLALHIRQYPGSRPFGWWAFQAPERRRVLDGELHPHDDGSTPAALRTLSYGVPESYHTPAHFQAVYESQADYLRRLRLLSVEEKRALALQESEEDAEAQDTPHVTLAQITTWRGER